MADLPTAAELAAMQEAIDFVAGNWWRRWIIRLVSNGKVRFERRAVDNPPETAVG